MRRNFDQIDQSNGGCSGQPMKWLLYWADCKRVRAFTNQVFKCSKFNNFLWEHNQVGKGGEKRGGLEIGIYLSSGLRACGLWWI